jgi:hypothetical protein
MRRADRTNRYRDRDRDRDRDRSRTRTTDHRLIFIEYPLVRCGTPHPGCNVYLYIVLIQPLVLYGFTNNYPFSFTLALRPKKSPLRRGCFMRALFH